MFNETNSKQIEEMKTKYETEKKDKEIALLTKDKEIQNIEIKKQKFIKNSFIGGRCHFAACFHIIFIITTAQNNY